MNSHEIPRKYLPSMSVFCAFEAAARHQSFTGAALELSLTQSAVSRQIRALEELLGTDLFVRERQTVRLNKAGEAYAGKSARRSSVSAATLGFRANPQGGTLNIAILPTFGIALAGAEAAGVHGGQSWHHHQPGHAPGVPDFATEPVDAAIHFGLPVWPGPSWIS